MILRRILVLKMKASGNGQRRSPYSVTMQPQEMSHGDGQKRVPLCAFGG
jgi:hypothetical protein